LPRVSFLGLATAHPTIYAAVLSRLGATIGAVWDVNSDKAAGFVAQFGGQVTGSPEAAVAEGADGVIICEPPPGRAALALMTLARGMPTYVTKPLATNELDLEAMLAAASTNDCPLLSTSVLRFAPKVKKTVSLIESGELGTVMIANARASHGIAGYMREPNRWIDDPETGGGTIFTLGIHCVEPLVAMLGERVDVLACSPSRRAALETQSEDTATIALRWDSGVTAAVQVIGSVDNNARNGEWYEFDVIGDRGRAQSVLRGGTSSSMRELGYADTMRAVLAMFASGRSPVEADETRTVIRTLLAARASASGLGALPGRPESLARRDR
jgi:predicted dehydrogenase